MRLNGRAAIMRYLGADETNKRRWSRILYHYGDRIYRMGSGNRSRYWTHAEWLDEIDLSRSVPCYADAVHTVDALEALWQRDKPGLMAYRKQKQTTEKELVAV